MKRTAIATGFIIFALVGVAIGSEIGNLQWNQSDIETLRSFDKSAVVRYLNEQRRSEGMPELLTAADIDDFQWTDLAGNGKYELVLTTSGPCAHFFSILSRDSAAKLTVQSIPGRGDVKNAIRDLNGDGTDELIILADLISYDCASTYGWPAVYRSENGRYVEASRDFPRFYDEEVLPQLAKRINQSPAKGLPAAYSLVPLIMEQDKILRVLGREPTAGLRQAYEWMNSADPHLLQAAAVTFQEIGGHESDLRAATAALERARAQQRADGQGG